MSWSPTASVPGRLVRVFLANRNPNQDQEPMFRDLVWVGGDLLIYAPSLDAATGAAQCLARILRDNGFLLGQPTGARFA